MRIVTHDGEGRVISTEETPDPPEVTNRATLEDRARAALDANRTYLALTSPTNAQTLAQVRSLSRQTNALIRLLLHKLDATD